MYIIEGDILIDDVEYFKWIHLKILIKQRLLMFC